MDGNELTPRQRALAARFEEELRAFRDRPARNAAEEIRDRVEELVRTAVEDCGFDVFDQQRAVESVELVADGKAISFTYKVDPRVNGYIEAILEGDVERAILTRRAREG